MYKAIIYDIDGTLLDTIKMNMYPLMKIIKEELNEDKTYEEVKHFFSYTGKATLESLGIDYESVYPRWVQYVNEYEKAAAPFDGIIDLLSGIDGKIPQAIVSSKTRKQYDIDMNQNQMSRYFNTLVLFEDTLVHKPDPEPILKCIEKLYLKPEDVLYVGDALADFNGAKNAKVDFAFASWCGIEFEELKDYPLTFPHPHDLLAYILENIRC